MPSAKCHSTHETSGSEAAPARRLRRGGSPFSSGPARRGGAGLTALLIILLVALAAVCVGSTLWAMRVTDERDRAQENFARSSRAIDRMIAATANSGKLKGASAAADREEVFGPAIQYYENTLKQHENDEAMLPEVASAHLHLAALQAKLGSAECLDSLGAGLNTIGEMTKSEMEFEPDQYPSFQDSVLRITPPLEWMSVKTEDRMSHGMKLFLNIQTATTSYRALTEKFPEDVGFRDDLSELLKSGAQFLAAVGRSEVALRNWLEAQQLLESLVRDEPNNVEFKERLAESLVSAARLQQKQGETDKARANFEQAVEIRQQLADADPEDKTLAKALADAKGGLERLAKAEAPAPEADGEDAAGETTPKDDAQKEEPAEEEAPEEASGDAPADDDDEASQP